MTLKRKGGLVDPVEKGANPQEEEMASLDMGKVSSVSFKPIPIDAARIRAPFDGYPLKKFQFAGVTTYESFIVALNPTTPVPQDQANRKVRQADGTLKQVNSCHSRVIRDRETNDNMHVPFDRSIEVNGITYQCAIVPSHNVRAQICFAYDANKQRIVVDPRYMLLDIEQRNRLRTVFEQVINPNIKMEKEAAYIAGESSVETDGMAALPAE